MAIDKTDLEPRLMIANKKTIEIAVASGKGGTGKTLLSTNLAAFIGESQNVLLADLDVEEPNDAIFFSGELQKVLPQYKMIPEWDSEKCTMCGLCAKVCNFGAVANLGDSISIFSTLCHNCYACSELCPVAALPMKESHMGDINVFDNGLVHLLEGRLNTNEEHSVPLINKVHEEVQKNYSHIKYQIFDSPPGTSCSVVAATGICDYVILVTEPTPFGVNDLILAVDMLRVFKKPMGVIINRDGAGNEKIEEFCQKEKIDLLGRIPFDIKIAQAYSKGELLMNNSPFKKIMSNIFDAIIKLDL